MTTLLELMVLPSLSVERERMVCSDHLTLATVTTRPRASPLAMDLRACMVFSTELTTTTDAASIMETLRLTTWIPAQATWRPSTLELVMAGAVPVLALVLGSWPILRTISTLVNPSTRTTTLP